jgi:hypothetical protein
MDEEDGIKVRIKHVGDEFWINAREMIDYLNQIAVTSEQLADEIGPRDPLRGVGYLACAEKFGTLAQAMDLCLIEAASGTVTEEDKEE